MALPALVRTWRFQLNQASAAGGSALVSCQNLMFIIKQSLIGAGAWTDVTGAAAAAAGTFVVRSASNGAGAFGNGDGVDRWLAAAGLVWANAGTNHSWIVLRQVGIGATFELCIDLGNAATSSASVVVSYVGFSLNGTATNRPTAPDEEPLINNTNWGGPTVATASTAHVMNSVDGKSNRVLVCRNGFVPIYWIFELPIEVTAGWLTPFVAIALGDATNAPANSRPTYGNLSNAANAYGITSHAFQAYLTAEANTTDVLGAQQVVANDMGGGWAIYDMGVYSLTPNSKGRLGKLVDIFWGSTALVDSDTFPAAGTKNFCVFGDQILPWDTSAPVFGGGVSTARDGEYAPLDAFASSTYLQNMAPGPDATSIPTGTAEYLMQAWDSVTNGYFSWPRPTPDFSGTGYPGPNAPAFISVSAVLGC